MFSGSAVVLYIAAAKLLFHLLTANRYGIFRDELYYLACSEHLDWGYVDQPPLIALVIWVSKSAFGSSLLALRFLPALAGAGLVWLTGNIAKEIGGGRMAQALAALAVALARIYLLMHHWMTMNAFEPLIWMGCVWCIVRSINTAQYRYWLGFGVLIGIGMETKYTIAFFVLGVIIGLLATPERQVLKSRWIWIGALVAFIIFLPNLVWLIQHDFPFLELMNKRGPMVREVRGLGTLVPEEVRWVPALRDGLVERIGARPGDTVKPDTVLLVLSNPELEQQVVDAALQVRAAEADLANTRAQLQTQLLNQQATQTNVESAYKQAKLQADADAELAAKGLISTITMKKSAFTADALAIQNEMEKKRVEINAKSAEAQLAASEARVDQLRASLELKRRQVEQLKVHAEAHGVLQQVAVEVGQRVTPGTILAKVAEPDHLKAELKIAETQAKDIALGQIASIDTRNGIIPGSVMRIDPAAVNGTVTVDVQLKGELPKGARPDLSVDGTIELERLSDVIYVGRPAFGQSDSTVGMFKLRPDGEAVRTQVKLGRSSVNTIEVIEGLAVGDQVILSDMSAWDAFDRVRLN